MKFLTRLHRLVDNENKIQIADLLLKLAAFTAACWAAYQYEGPLKWTEREKAEAELTPALEVSGALDCNSGSILVGRYDYPVHVAHINIRNSGIKPVSIQTVELRVFAGRTEDITQIARTMKGDKGQLEVIWSLDPSDPAPSHLIGTIEPDSVAWIELERLRQITKSKNTVLATGQSRHERRHFLLNPDPTILHKIEVTVTHSGGSYVWYHFLSHGSVTICQPIIPAPEISED